MENQTFREELALFLQQDFGPELEAFLDSLKGWLSVDVSKLPAETVQITEVQVKAAKRTFIEGCRKSLAYLELAAFAMMGKEESKEAGEMFGALVVALTKLVGEAGVEVSDLGGALPF